ncbi:MAG: hypothetical protein H5U36_04660 [Candidatus Caldatribacterium sp.]|nr:hypothetical protein [Candidatus Caldatribacterium sp.]
MDRTFLELREALGKPGCFLCRLEESYVRRFLEALFYEFVTDRGVREKIRKGGFCKDHARRLFALRPSILGIAIVYQDLLHQYLSGTVPDAKLCPVCLGLQEYLTRIVHLLGKHWEDLHQSWGKETFVCLPHLASLPEPLRGRLEDTTKVTLQGILDTLSSFIEKFDYQKSGLPPKPEEARSWQEAMEFFVGDLVERKKS